MKVSLCAYAIILAMVTQIASAQSNSQGQATAGLQVPARAVHFTEEPTGSNPFNTVQVAANSSDAQIDELVSSLVDTFNDMIAELRYSEAAVVARQVGELKPGSTIATKLLVISRIKNAESEADQSAAERELSELLATIFDEDLQRREKDVEGIRNRVAKLIKQIDKRRNSKDKVIDIQFRVQVNEADGLGFVAGNPNRSYDFQGSAGAMSEFGSQRSPYGTPVGMSARKRVTQQNPLKSPNGFDIRDGRLGRSSQAPNDLSNAITTLRSATNADEKNAARKTLKTALAAFFEADLKRRESEISGIQERVEMLEQQIENRREAKDQIISLQLEVLKNEAEGLGFFSNPGDPFSPRSRAASSRMFRSKGTGNRPNF